MSDKTTAENLESRFETGEDVLDDFDLSKAFPSSRLSESH
jgi:hypothetical protein